MSDLDDFLAPTLARQLDVFGAKVPLRSGWDDVSEILRWLAASSTSPTR